MHHWWADEYGDEEQHPPQEGDDKEEDAEISESPNAPKVVWRDLYHSCQHNHASFRKARPIQLDHQGRDNHHFEVEANGISRLALDHLNDEVVHDSILFLSSLDPPLPHSSSPIGTPCSEAICIVAFARWYQQQPALEDLPMTLKRIEGRGMRVMHETGQAVYRIVPACILIMANTTLRADVVEVEII